MDITSTKLKKYQTRLMVKDNEDIIGSLKKLPLYFLFSSLKFDLNLSKNEGDYSLTLTTLSWDRMPNLDVKTPTPQQYGCADRDKDCRFRRYYYIDDRFIPGTLVAYIKMICDFFCVDYTLEEFTNNENCYVLKMDTKSISFCKSYALFHCIRHGVFMPNRENYFALFLVQINKEVSFKNLNEFLNFFIKISQLLSINSTYNLTGYNGTDYTIMSNFSDSGINLKTYFVYESRVDVEQELDKMPHEHTTVDNSNSFKYFINTRYLKKSLKSVSKLLFTDSYSFLFNKKEPLNFDKSKIVKDFKQNFKNNKDTFTNVFDDYKVFVVNSDVIMFNTFDVQCPKYYSITKSLKNLNEIYEFHNRN